MIKTKEKARKQTNQDARLLVNVDQLKIILGDPIKMYGLTAIETCLKNFVTTKKFAKVLRDECLFVSRDFLNLSEIKTANNQFTILNGVSYYPLGRIIGHVFDQNGQKYNYFANILFDHKPGQKLVTDANGHTCMPFQAHVRDVIVVKAPQFN
jgi:hypothetical protein